MIMKKSIVLIIILLMATLTSCEKLVKTSWVYYDETYCADPWGHSTTEYSRKIKDIEAYFKEKKIRIFKTEILHDRVMEMCHSCGCKSGNRIRCKIKSKDKSEMIDLSFYEE